MNIVSYYFELNFHFTISIKYQIVWLLLSGYSVVDNVVMVVNEFDVFSCMAPAQDTTVTVMIVGLKH